MKTNSPTEQPVSNLQPIRSSRHWPRPRFSLRVLLLAITVFAIVFPLWYVWPYTVRESIYPFDATGNPDKNKPRQGEIISQMKRVFGGPPVKHGQHVVRTFSKIGTKEIIQEFVDGILHGEYTVRQLDVVQVQGQYEHGLKTGEWMLNFGDVMVRQSWRNGKLHGDVELDRGKGELETFTYADDVLTHHNGRPASFPIFQRLAEGRIAPGRELSALQDNAGLVFVRTPLSDVVAYLNDFHQTSIQIDPAVLSSSQSKHGPEINSNLRGINLMTVLAVMADDAGLVCDYKDNAVYFTQP